MTVGSTAIPTSNFIFKCFYLSCNFCFQLLKGLHTLKAVTLWLPCTYIIQVYSSSQIYSVEAANTPEVQKSAALQNCAKPRIIPAGNQLSNIIISLQGLDHQVSNVPPRACISRRPLVYLYLIISCEWCVLYIDQVGRLQSTLIHSHEAHLSVGDVPQ